MRPTNSEESHLKVVIKLAAREDPQGGCCSSQLNKDSSDGVRECANKTAASAASPDYVKFQAVIKLAASAASPRRGRAGGRLDHDLFSQFLARPQKI